MSPVFLATNQSPYFLSKTGTLPLVYNRLTLLFVYKPTFCFVYKATPSLLTTVYSNNILQCTLSLTSPTCKVQSSLGLEHPSYARLSTILDSLSRLRHRYHQKWWWWWHHSAPLPNTRCQVHNIVGATGSRSQHVTACLLPIKCAVFPLLKVVCKLEQSTWTSPYSIRNSLLLKIWCRLPRVARLKEVNVAFFPSLI